MRRANDAIARRMGESRKWFQGEENAPAPINFLLSSYAQKRHSE